MDNKNHFTMLFLESLVQKLVPTATVIDVRIEGPSLQITYCKPAYSNLPRERWNYTASRLRKMIAPESMPITKTVEWHNEYEESSVDDVLAYCQEHMRHSRDVAYRILGKKSWRAIELAIQNGRQIPAWKKAGLKSPA